MVKSAPALWVVVIAPAHGSTNPRRDADTALPSPYRTYVGTRSMLEHTIDRALQLVPGDRLVTVVAREHRRYLDEALAVSPPGLLLEQPRDCGNGAAVMLALAHVLERDPEATVLVLPVDHFIHPEQRFMRVLANASRLAGRSGDRLIVLGAVPHHSEADAERIVTAPGARERPLDREPSSRFAFGSDGASADPGAMLRWHDGPSASEAFRDGGLWNTNIFAARAATFWDIGRQLLPDMVRSFGMLRQVV